MKKRIKAKIVDKPEILDSKYSVSLPHNGCKVSVTYESKDITGVLLMDDEVIQVYLDKMEATQTGGISLPGQERTHSVIRRVFTFIEV